MNRDHNIINLKSKVYSMHSNIYVPAHFKLKYVIKYTVNLSLKSKLMVFYHCHLWVFFHSLPFSNSLPIELIKVAI